MSFLLQGLGTAHPPHAMSLNEAKELAQTICCDTEKQRRIVEAIYRRSGVANRFTCVPHQKALDWVELTEDGWRSAPHRGPTMAERMALYEEHAGATARTACREALRESQIDATAITHLITVTCTGFFAPGVDIGLMQELGLRPTTERIQLGFMGCHAVVNALRVARGLAADPAHRILLVAVELCSLHYCYEWDPERLVGNALFADGAAAVVGGGPDTDQAFGRVTATGSCLFPDSRDDLTWRIGNHGFEMTLGVQVPELIEQHLRPWLLGWLAQRDLTIESINAWAIHPGGPRVVSAVGKALDLPAEATAVSREVLSAYGNMSSPTILFIVNQLRRNAHFLPCVALGFGPGLVAEAALIE